MNEELGELRVVGEVVNMSADESIIDENGNIDFDKLQPLSFDSATGSYRVLGERVGNALKIHECLLSESEVVWKIEKLF